MRFRSVNEVIQRANATHYGLAAGVFTNDIDKALTVSSALQAGMVWYVWTPPKAFDQFRQHIHLAKEHRSVQIL